MTAPYRLRPFAWPHPDPPGSLHLRVRHPVPSIAVVEANGEIDLATAPHLADVVEARLRSAVGLVVIDLRGTTFLAVAGLHTLHRLHLRAQTADADLYVDPGASRIVRRLLDLFPLSCERPGAADLALRQDPR